MKSGSAGWRTRRAPPPSVYWFMPPMHEHDAPVMDEDAEKLLRAMEVTGAWKNLAAPAPDAPVQVASIY